MCWEEREVSRGNKSLGDKHHKVGLEKMDYFRRSTTINLSRRKSFLHIQTFF